MENVITDRKRSQREAGGGEELPKRKKVKKESRRKRPGFTEDIYKETTYYIKKGLRYVKPYYFTFTTHAKGRWVGSKVIDVFSREFQSETPEFYRRAIEAGKITVDDKVATEDTVIGHNELVCHTVHRHEPPVTAQPLTLIHNDEHLVVLDKPPSIPVHPCGRYRHNSVVFLLGKEHNLKNLHTVHRLDRLTSGLLMFAKTVAKAQQLEQQIRQRIVTKIYVCRVKGEFPREPIECNEPILVVSHKLGVCRVDSSGKECSTHFTRLSFNGKSSVVQCVPKTGRMHQIRVHLQWLGYPIMNDPLYGHPAWKVGGESDSVDVDHVISEIVKTNYASKSHDQTSEKGHDSHQSQMEERASISVKDSVGKGSTGEGVDTDGTTAERCTVGENTPQDNFTVQTIGQSSGEETSNMTTEARGQSIDEPEDFIEVPVESKGQSADVPVESKGQSVGDADVQVSELMKEKAESSLELGQGGQSDVSLVDESKSAECDGNVSCDPDCTECKTVHADPTPSELMMYLHALSYKGEGWEYSTAMPLWALHDWEEGQTES